MIMLNICASTIILMSYAIQSISVPSDITSDIGAPNELFVLRYIVGGNENRTIATFTNKANAEKVKHILSRNGVNGEDASMLAYVFSSCLR